MDDAKRTALKSYEGKTVDSIYFPKAGNLVVICFSDGTSLSADPDHLYDDDGMRVSTDTVLTV